MPIGVRDEEIKIDRFTRIDYFSVESCRDDCKPVRKVLYLSIAFFARLEKLDFLVSAPDKILHTCACNLLCLINVEGIVLPIAYIDGDIEIAFIALLGISIRDLKNFSVSAVYSNSEVTCASDIAILVPETVIDEKVCIAIEVHCKLAHAIDRVSCLKYKVLFLLEQYIVPITKHKAFAYNAVFLIKHVVGHIHQSVHIAVR